MDKSRVDDLIGLYKGYRAFVDNEQAIKMICEVYGYSEDYLVEIINKNFYEGV